MVTQSTRGMQRISNTGSQPTILLPLMISVSLESAQFDDKVVKRQSQK